MFDHLKLHGLSFLLLLLPMFITIAAQSNNVTNINCPSSTCGDVTIKYPFYRMVDTEPTNHLCGYEGFGITCSEQNISQIWLGDHAYHIRVIDYEIGTMFLFDSDVSSVVRGPNNCPRISHNINLGNLPFVFALGTVNITFRYGCNGCPLLAREIPCLGRNGEMACLTNTSRGELDWDGYSCDQEVVTTVYSDVMDLIFDVSTNFSSALEKGFGLRWERPEGCEECEESDGQCGRLVNMTELICFCPGGTRKGRCKGSDLSMRRKLIVGFVSAAITVLVVIAVLWFIRMRRQNKRRSYGSSYRSRNISSFTSSMTDPEKNGAYHGVQIFKYRELEKATNYFDSSNELGDGGFGTVYQGKLKDGRVVAVKRLYENNYKRVEQFMNEVGILAHLRHRNLVSLYGCTTHHSRELLLVYEYISNGTVADHLHGEKSNPSSLTWTTRMNIAIETASALVYLHASEVVHRDVKTNNILLDNSFTVKVADFGLSRLFPNNVTHVSTAPQGTPGYVDPEYHECYQLTNKSDVYSFGVVLVELISSKPAVDITRHRHEINLSSMALSKIQNDALHELVDPHLGYETDREVRKMINAVAELAFQCLQNERDSRPSMEKVLKSLVGIQNEMSGNKKQDVLDGTCDGAVLLNHSHDMSPDSVAAAWSTSTLSTSSG